MKVAVFLFDNFETLDVFGPVEIFGRLPELYSIAYYSAHGGMVRNLHGISILTEKLQSISGEIAVFLIPGGIGTRKVVTDEILVKELRRISESSRHVLSVCTGSAVLAKTGLLQNREATSNKRSFSWVTTNDSSVKWNKKARWVVDGKYFTSSGVSAGIDMSLAFIAARHGTELAEKITLEIEYHWNQDGNEDRFVAH